MNYEKKKELIKLFTPAAITAVIMLLTSISSGTWKFTFEDILANLILIFIFAGAVFGVTYGVMSSKKAKEKKAEALRIAEEQRRIAEEQERIRQEEAQRKYDEWFNSLSESEKQTELQKRYYQQQLALEQEKIALERQRQEIESRQAEQFRQAQEQQIAELRTANSLQQAKMNAMLKCPKCGSTSITGQKKGYGVVKGGLGAAAIGAVTGPVGAIVGLGAGNIGRSKVKCTCMNCGYKFKAGRK